MSHQRAEASNWASRALSRRTRVIVEESAQTLTPVDAADASLGGCALDQLVSEALVIPLTVVMLDELGDRPVEMTLTERDHQVEALLVDRTYEALRVGIRIGRLVWGLRDADPGLTQPLAHRPAPLRVTVTDQHPMATQDTLVSGRERP